MKDGNESDQSGGKADWTKICVDAAVVLLAAGLIILPAL